MRPDLNLVLKIKLGVTLVLWAIPCLLLPAGAFRYFGLSLEGSVVALVFVRLLGAMFVALCVGYGLALVDPSNNAGMRIVGVVSNGLGSVVLWLLIFQGRLVDLPLRGKAYLVVSAVLTALLALALAVARRYPKPEVAPALKSATLPRDTANA